MGEVESSATESQFSNSSRTGRRNAVVDIDVNAVDPTGEKLAERFSQMGKETAAEDEANKPSTSTLDTGQDDSKK